MTDTVWLYLVVSSDAQEESLEAQRRWGFEEAARIGASVDPEGIFEGVATGKHGARSILADLIRRLGALSKAQRPSRVLMVRLDRTGRMPLDAIAALNDLRKLGVIIRTRKDGDLKFSRVIDMVGPTFELLQAGFENEVRSDRSRAGHKRRRDEGKLTACKPPYGVMRAPDGKGVPDPDCAPIVREVFRRWARGESPGDVVIWLRQNAPPRATKKGNLAPRWSLSHLYKMVHLPTYLQWGVVTQNLWDRAQARKRRASRRGPGGRIYPFAGIRCTCGYRMHSRINAGPMRHVLRDGTEVIYHRKKQTAWYICQSMQHKTGPKFRSYREDRIERSWLAFLKCLRPGYGAWESIRRDDPQYAERIEAIDKHLERLAGRRDRIHAAFEDGSYSSDVMQRRLAAVQRDEERLLGERAYLSEEQRKAKGKRITRETAMALRKAARAYKAGTRAEKRAINERVFEIFGYPTVNDAYALTLPGATGEFR